MSKAVPIRLKSKDPAQAFVEAGEEPRARDYRVAETLTATATGQGGAPDKADIVRITLDLPKSLHRKLKIHVAGEGITIADYLRSLLTEKLP
jgi:predicted DNA binding CopG/RHH family protein